MRKQPEKQIILCGARDSLLSFAQVKEVQEECFSLPLVLKPVWIKTRGDKDKATSLRTLEKTDFFTQELDDLLLRGQIRIAIHSAKDLPDPLRKGLKIVALTKGKDPRDSLVFKKPLPEAPCIATSSYRREETVRELYPKASFIDLRGTIHERLEVLDKAVADGVVIAEAALIRLNLTHLTRVVLPGDTTAGQGKLAILAREEDEEMRFLFGSFYDSLSRA